MGPEASFAPFQLLRFPLHMDKDIGVPAEDPTLKAMKLAFQERVHVALLTCDEIPDLATFDPVFRDNQKELTSALASLVSKNYVKTETIQVQFFEQTLEGKEVLAGKPTDEQAILAFIGDSKPKVEVTAQFKGPVFLFVSFFFHFLAVYCRSCSKWVF
jgi:hypothetical protein